MIEAGNAEAVNAEQAKARQLRGQHATHRQKQ